MNSYLSKMVKYRHYFHKHPELAFEEINTSKYILGILKKFSCFEIKPNIHRADKLDKTSIVATYTKNISEPFIALRSDMDALPIEEKTNLEFSSKNTGISHSCGHDLHMSCLLAFAEYIQENQDKISYNIKLIFQPAEELDKGALELIKDGVLDDVEMIYGFHVFNPFPLGTIAATKGVLLGATHELNIKIRGRSGHGAEPFRTRDPITKASMIIQELLQIKSHKITSYEPSALTICSIHGGEAFNVIPESVHLRGSIRTVSADVFNQYKKEICKLSHSEDFDIDIDIRKTSPYTINHEEPTINIRKAICKIGNMKILTHYQSLLGEDFSYYLEKIPGCFILVGSGFCDKVSPPHHSAEFDCDERVMAIIFNILKNLVTISEPKIHLNITEYYHNIIPSVFKNTPQYYSEKLSQDLGLNLLLKLEVNNPIRSFKARGAYAFIDSLKDKSRTLVTASVGNFGQGMLYACRDRNVNLIVFASVNANTKKIEKMKSLCENTNNAVKLVGRDFDEAKKYAVKYAEYNNLFFVEDGKIESISQGAGTIAYELPKNLDAVFVPIGNGALIIGITKYMKRIRPDIKILGVCAEGAPCMKLSYDQKECVETVDINTIADGVGVRVPIPKAVNIINQIVDDIILVSEDKISYWMEKIRIEEGVIVEGAGEIALAAISQEKEKWEAKKVCALVCGGNI